MAEDLLPDLTNFSLTEEPSVDNQSQEQEEKKEDIVPDMSAYAPVVKFKGKQANRQMSPIPLGGLGLGDSKLDFNSKKQQGLTLEQALDINETRGRRQRTGDK